MVKGMVRGWAMGALVVGAFVVGGCADGPSVELVYPAPSAPAAASVLASALPFYGVQAPEWCAEDMPCWIGSAADGRSADEILASLPADLVASSRVYGSAGGWVPADVGWSTEPDGTTHTGCLVQLGDTSTVVCPDGYVSQS